MTVPRQGRDPISLASGRSRGDPRGPERGPGGPPPDFWRGCYLARFLDLVCNRIGVPMKPNFLRIWLTRYRSWEKCSAGPLSVNTAKEGGRMECWVM